MNDEHDPDELLPADSGDMAFIQGHVEKAIAAAIVADMERCYCGEPIEEFNDDWQHIAGPLDHPAVRGDP